MFRWSDVCSASDRLSQRTHSVSTVSYSLSNDFSVLGHTSERIQYVYITKTNYVRVRIYSSEVPRICVRF